MLEEKIMDRLSGQLRKEAPEQHAAYQKPKVVTLSLAELVSAMVDASLATGCKCQCQCQCQGQNLAS